MAYWTDPVDRQPGDPPTVLRSLMGITYVLTVSTQSTRRGATSTLVVRQDDHGQWWASIADMVRWQ